MNLTFPPAAKPGESFFLSGELDIQARETGRIRPGGLVVGTVLRDGTVDVTTYERGRHRIAGTCHSPVDLTRTSSPDIAELPVLLTRMAKSVRHRHRRLQLRDQWWCTDDLVNHRQGFVRADGVSFSDANDAELRALRLLREMIDGQAFRRYLKSGFVRVQGDGGLTYHLTRTQHTIGVWDQYVEVARLCVHLADDYPPTDNIIALMLMIEHDERDVWCRANVTSFGRGNEMRSEMVA